MARVEAMGIFLLVWTRSTKCYIWHVCQHLTGALPGAYILLTTCLKENRMMACKIQRRQHIKNWRKSYTLPVILGWFFLFFSFFFCSCCDWRPLQGLSSLDSRRQARFQMAFKNSLNILPSSRGSNWFSSASHDTFWFLSLYGREMQKGMVLTGAGELTKVTLCWRCSLQQGVQNWGLRWCKSVIPACSEGPIARLLQLAFQPMSPGSR